MKTLLWLRPAALLKDARKQIAVVDQGGWACPSRTTISALATRPEDSDRQYVQHITNRLKLMGEPGAKATSDAQAIMQLETALAKVAMMSRRDADPKSRSIT